MRARVAARSKQSLAMSMSPVPWRAAPALIMATISRRTMPTWRACSAACWKTAAEVDGLRNDRPSARAALHSAFHATQAAGQALPGGSRPNVDSSSGCVNERS